MSYTKWILLQRPLQRATFNFSMVIMSIVTVLLVLWVEGIDLTTYFIRFHILFSCLNICAICLNCFHEIVTVLNQIKYNVVLGLASQ